MMTNQTKPNQINQKQGNAFNILSFFQPIPWMHSKWLLELLEVLASQADATWLICCVMAGIPQLQGLDVQALMKTLQDRFMYRSYNVLPGGCFLDLSKLKYFCIFSEI